MRLYIAADHAGFALKEALVPFLRDDLHYEVEDCGAFEMDPADDYPEIMAAAAAHVLADLAGGIESRAIIFGKSGQGEAMVANRFPNVRAALYYGGTLDIIRLSREHNDANVLSLGAGFLTVDEAKEAIRLWSETAFSGEERHQYRIEKMEEAAEDAIQRIEEAGEAAAESK
jgi:ribose 5-phosphate isomerase B